MPGATLDQFLDVAVPFPNPRSCLGLKSPEIPTLCRTTLSILGPCLGKMSNTHSLVFQFFQEIMPGATLDQFLDVAVPFPKPRSCLGLKSPEIPTLCRTTLSILGPCLGKMSNTHFLVFCNFIRYRIAKYCISQI